MTMTNQQIYTEYNIQPTDSDLIAEKFGFTSKERSDDEISQIRAVASQARSLKLSVKKYLAGLQVEKAATSNSQAPRADRVQAPVDGSAVDDFQMAIANTSERIAQGSLQVLRNMDAHLDGNESAFADAMVDRIAQSPARAARKVIDRLSHEQPNFFQFAPTGAAGAFAAGASAILALPDSGVPQSGYAALKQAQVVEENDQGTEQQGE